MSAATSSRRVALVLGLLVISTACTSDPVGVSQTAPLDDATLAAVHITLQDEYNASAVYSAIMNRFGAIMPFVNIERAERQHAASLAALLSSRGIQVPDDASASLTMPVFASVNAACAAAADAEVANIALYDEVLEDALPADVRRVFENNRRASLQNHLPAFQRCR